MKKQCVFFMGYMGSGKSSIGKKIANKLGFNFIDLDVEIERLTEKSISEIFELKGEEAFRKLESETLRKTGKKDVVIALGGGTACTDENIDYINSNGYTVYLKLSNEKLIGRLRQNKSKRPLIAKLNDKEIGEFVENQLTVRSPYYEKAHLIVNVDELKPEKLHQLIRAQLS